MSSSRRPITMPETHTKAPQGDCWKHNLWVPCLDCLLNEIGQDLENCTVYLLYRDPLFEDEKWEEWE